MTFKPIENIRIVHFWLPRNAIKTSSMSDYHSEDTLQRNIIHVFQFIYYGGQNIRLGELFSRVLLSL